MADRVPMTKAGEARLREELKKLKSEDRPQVIAAIAEAREHGDLKENAEYTLPVSSRASSKAGFRKSKASSALPR